MASLLLVEDDVTLASGLSFALEREGHAVTCAHGKAEAERLLARAGFDLLILDVMLPDGSGFDVCRSVRRHSQVPVIFLTARDEEVNVVRGLDLGADDYVAKPFRVRELVSRIAAALRRAAPGEAGGRVLRAGPLTIDLAAARVHRGAQEVRLSAEEFRLLSLFARNPGQALSRGAIMERLLDAEHPFVDDNTLSVYVRRLREKLEEDPAAPRLIVTVRGVGYRWEGARQSTEVQDARLGRGMSRNPEARRLARGAALLCAALACLLATGLWLWWAGLSRALTERDAVLLGKALSASPGAEAAVISALTRAPSPAEAEAGREAARRYGYDADLPALLRPVLRGPLLGSVAGLFVFLLLAAAGFLLLARGALRRVFSRVRGVAEAAERMAEGSPGLRIPEMGEGDVSLLSHRVNQVAERLLTALEQVQGEREYLKAFLTDVSHQLKTPLASVRMFTDLSLDDVGEEKRRELLEKSQGQLDRMEWLIANLLSVARMEAGSVEFSVRETPLQDTLADVLSGLQEIGERRALTVRCRVPQEPVMAPHDRRWLAEALSNIVKNCIEHTPAGGSVTVTLERTHVLARITIEDTGEGIAPGDLPRLFDRFFQQAAPRGGAGVNCGPAAANVGPAPAIPATGVGLALARAIIEQHHGAVTAENVPARPGARFIVILPLREI